MESSEQAQQNPIEKGVVLASARRPFTGIRLANEAARRRRQPRYPLPHPETPCA